MAEQERAAWVQGNPVNGFHDELTSSPASILVALLVVPVLAALLAFEQPHPEQLLNLSLGMFVALALVGIVLARWPKGACWGTIALTAGLVLYLRFGMAIIGSLALMGVVVAVAGALVRSLGTLVTAAGVTALALLAPRWVGQSAGGYEPLVAILGAWLAALAALSRDRAARALAQWSHEHYAMSQAHVVEARQRQSELKQAIDALAHANRELELSNERIAIMRRMAEEAQRTKAAFVSNVSHEFRTPLNVIIGLAEVLAAGADVYGQELPEAAQRDIAILYRNTEHLSRMVDDVLDLGQVEAGRLPLRREWCDLEELVEGALTTVPPLIQAKGLYLRVHVERDLPEVYCDAVRIRQVLLNLVSNAVRYTGSGGIVVRVERQGQRAIVSVQDTGPGIAPDDLGRIFEPFQQALDHRAREGSGLGLSISRELIEMHQGHMWVESTLGEGSIFFFSLPLGPLLDHAVPSQRWLTEGWVARDTSMLPDQDARPHYLIIEPGDDLYPVLERYADAVCSRAATLAEARQRHAQEPAQMVLINAYRTDEVAAEVARYGEALPDVPVIGFNIAPRSHKGLNLDVLDYMLKPVHSDDLRQVLDRVPGPIERLLIVDDDSDTQWVLQRYIQALTEGRVAVRAVADGTAGLAEMDAWAPDVVLLDVVLPDMDGHEVLAAKRGREAIRDIPVVMISAQDMVETPVRSRLLAATMGEGLSWAVMLRAARTLSTLLVQAGADD